MGIKEFIEQLNDKKEVMQNLVEACKQENRTMSEEEAKQFDDLEAECKNIQKTIDRIQIADGIEMKAAPVVHDTDMTQEQKDTKEFADYIRATIQRLPIQTNITRSDNGDIIPVTIANKIIDRVKELSPVFASITKYNVKGSLYVPYIASENDNIAAAYATEFNAPTATAVTFSTVKLSNYLMSVNTVISKSLINNTDIDLVNFIVDKMAKAVAAFLDQQILVGNSSYITGMSTISNTVSSGTASTVKVDDVIELMAAVKQPYQNSAYFVMAPATLTALRKLKDGQGVYLLNNDITAPFGFKLLGKDVYCSDYMPSVSTGNNAIYYGDFTEGLVGNITEDFEIQILNEMYANQHAIGITGWMEADIKIQNEQAIAALTIS